MSICVSDLQGLQLFRDHFKLIGGAEGVKHPVQYITVMEVDDFADHALGQGLFVLTTFSNYRNDQTQMIATLEKLAKKNIAALAIKINRFIKVVPQGIIDIANQYTLPVFVIEHERTGISRNYFDRDWRNYQLSV